MLLKLLKRLLWGRSITKKDARELTAFIKKIQELSNKEQIVQYDKIYHHALKKLGYSGSFGEILKRNPREIGNIDDVWRLHKLRNSLVHDLKHWDEVKLEKQAFEYKTVCQRFIKQITS